MYFGQAEKNYIQNLTFNFLRLDLLSSNLTIKFYNSVNLVSSSHQPASQTHFLPLIIWFLIHFLKFASVSETLFMPCLNFAYVLDSA